MSASAASVSPSEPSPRTPVLIGRQPIFNIHRQVHGYELLYRNVDPHGQIMEDADIASAEVLSVSFVDIGIAKLVEKKKAYVNTSREFLLSREPMTLPPGRVVLEFPGDADFDESFLQVLDEYRAEGFSLLANVSGLTVGNLPLVKRADAVKLDVRILGLERSLREIEQIKPLQREVVAAHVESEDEFVALQAAGAQYFEGFFFAQPQIISGTRIAASKLTTLRLLASLHDPEAEVQEVSSLIGQDVGLSYKLMRFMNSAALSLPGEIDSIQRAVTFMGLSALKRWTSLVVVAGVDGKPSELTRALLVRARLCERLCAAVEFYDPDAAFTVGLFSGLDALVDRPLDEAVAELPLAWELKEALLEGKGVMASALNCAIAYERGDWINLNFAQLPATTIGTLYEEAVAWARDAMSEI